MKSAEYLWWICFTDPAKPRGRRFRCVIIVAASNPDKALSLAITRDAGLASGEFEFLMVPMPLGTVEEAYHNRPLTRADAEGAADI